MTTTSKQLELPLYPQVGDTGSGPIYEGFIAARNKYTSLQNPYEYGTIESQDWAYGFNEWHGLAD